MGEISLALERAFGRHQAEIRLLHDVYAKEAGPDPKIERARAMVEAFTAADGRPPRSWSPSSARMATTAGQKVIATGFADLGFNVDVGALFATPEEAAAEAARTDVHTVGVSSLAAGHLTLVPELKAALAAEGRSDIMMVVGGVIPDEDLAALEAEGVAAVFQPGTVIADAAIRVLDELNKRLGYAQA